MGDRIVIMNKGHIQQVDTPQNIYAHPANLFVASFIGSPQMNFLDTVLQQDGSGFFCEILGNRISLADVDAKPETLQAYLGRAIVFGIRPEHLLLEVQDDTARQDLLRGAQLDLIEMLGAEAYLHLELGTQTVLARTPGDNLPTVGQTYNLCVQREKLHLFDAESGAALPGPHPVDLTPQESEEPAQMDAPASAEAEGQAEVASV